MLITIATLLLMAPPAGFSVKKDTVKIEPVIYYDGEGQKHVTEQPYLQTNRPKRPRIPAMLTLWEEPSWEALDAWQLIPGEPRIRDVVHEARVAGFNEIPSILSSRAPGA